MVEGRFWRSLFFSLAREGNLSQHWIFAVRCVSCWQCMPHWISPDCSDSTCKVSRTVSKGYVFILSTFASCQEYREIQERSQRPTSTFLACELQTLVLRDLLLLLLQTGVSPRQPGSPELFVSLPSVGSLLHDKTGSSKKSPCQPKAHTHTHVSLLQWQAEDYYFFFPSSLPAESVNNRLWQLVSLRWLGWPWRGG